MLVVIAALMEGFGFTRYRADGFTIQIIEDMATVRILLCMFCFVFVGSRGLSGSSIVSNEQIVAIAQSQIEQVVGIAQSQVGIREATGNNDGRRWKLT